MWSSKPLSHSLRTLRESFYAKPQNRGKSFPAPDGYDSPGGSVRVIAIDPSTIPSDPDDQWAVTPGLLRMKPQFPKWLWRACNKALDHDDLYYEGPHGLSRNDRERAMSSALKWIRRYPVRPDSTLPASKSVDELRAVLRLAPKVAEELHKDVEQNLDTRYKLDYHYDGFSGEDSYFWGNRFLEDLFQALINVIEEHGLTGWENVRWEVYDKVRMYDML